MNNDELKQIANAVDQLLSARLAPIEERLTKVEGKPAGSARPMLNAAGVATGAAAPALRGYGTEDGDAFKALRYRANDPNRTSRQRRADGMQLLKGQMIAAERTRPPHPPRAGLPPPGPGLTGQWASPFVEELMAMAGTGDTFEALRAAVGDHSSGRLLKGAVSGSVLKASEEDRFLLVVAYPAMKADVGVAADGRRDFAGPGQWRRPPGGSC